MAVERVLICSPLSFLKLYASNKILKSERKIIPTSSEKKMAMNPKLQAMKHRSAKYCEKYIKIGEEAEGISLTVNIIVLKGQSNDLLIRSMKSRGISRP